MRALAVGVGLVWLSRITTDSTYFHDIFGPLLVPVAQQLGFKPLHYGPVLVVAMGIGLFAPPLGLGLYGSCLIGRVPIEVTMYVIPSDRVEQVVVLERDESAKWPRPDEPGPSA